MNHGYWRAALFAALLSACGSDDPAPKDEARPSEAASDAPTATPSSEAAPGRTSQYTALENCKLLEENVEEAGYSLSACPGVAGYALQLVEGDLRQNLIIKPPGGGESDLNFPAATGSGGFSRMGAKLEWRGTGEGAAFRPEALITRYFVVEDPEKPEKETSFLVVIALTGAKPCITAAIRPGADQNERARAAADEAMRCMAEG